MHYRKQPTKAHGGGTKHEDLFPLSNTQRLCRALVIALNKWDGIEADERDWIRSELRRRLQFIDYADIHFISALHGSGVGKLVVAVAMVSEAAAFGILARASKDSKVVCADRPGGAAQIGL